MSLQVFAWDESGSTDSMRYYFKTGVRYLEEFESMKSDTGQNQEEVKKVFLKWGSHCVKSSYEDLTAICKNHAGKGGGTSPQNIIEYILKGLETTKHEITQIELWLITDGEIYPSDLAKCSQLNKQLTHLYSKIKFVIISESKKINMSVGAAFFSGANVEIHYNDSLYKSINTSVPFDYNSISTQNFKAKWEELSDFIQAKFMGSDRESLEEVDKLTRLRKRLLDSLSTAEGSFGNKFQPQFPSKDKADIVAALKKCEFYKSLTTTALRSERMEIDSSISKLINYIHNDHKSYGFENLKIEYKQDKLADETEVVEPKLEDLVDEQPVTFYDAISLEEERGQPILLLHVTDLIEKLWINGSYAKFRFIIDCPFFAKLDDSIGHVFSIETYMDMCAHLETSENWDGMLKNPMTNLPISGGIICTPAADKWNDYVLSQTYFRGKKVATKNLSIWYYMIWKCCEGKSWIESSIVEKLKTYALYRLTSMGNVRLGFSTLPLDPKEEVPLAIATFYCAELSSQLFGQNPELFEQEKLRMYHGVAAHFLNILKIFGYSEQVDSRFVLKRAEMWSIVGQLKRIPQDVEKRYFLLKSIFQIVTDGDGAGTGQTTFLTYNVQDKSKLWTLNLLNYNHKEMIPFNFSEQAFDFNSFIWPSYKSTEKNVVELSRKTFRPHFVVERNRTGNNNNNKSWIPNYAQILDCMENVRVTSSGETIVEPITNGKLDQGRLCSLYKLFIDCTHEKSAYPTLSEYKNYVAKNTRLKGGTHIRLHQPNIFNDIKEIFEKYDKFIAAENVPVEEFIKKTQDSVGVERRIEMEGSLKQVGKKFKEHFINNAKTMLVSYK